MHCSYGEGHPPSPGGCVATPPPTGTHALSQEVSPCLGRLGVLAGKAGGRAVTRVWSPCGARVLPPADAHRASALLLLARLLRDSGRGNKGKTPQHLGTLVTVVTT